MGRFPQLTPIRKQRSTSDTFQARTLNDIDPDALEVETFKGAELDPPYEPPASSRESKQAEDGIKVYNGNCHCGAVTYTVKTKPLTEVEVVSCNCSLCSRVRLLLLFLLSPITDLFSRTVTCGFTPRKQP